MSLVVPGSYRDQAKDAELLWFEAREELRYMV